MNEFEWGEVTRGVNHRQIPQPVFRVNSDISAVVGEGLGVIVITLLVLPVKIGDKNYCNKWEKMQFIFDS